MLSHYFLSTANKMRVQLKDLKVELHAQESEETGIIASAEFNIKVKSDVHEDRIQRIFNSRKLSGWKNFSRKLV
jgi:uncharacterized OsmC-like protein